MPVNRNPVTSGLKAGAPGGNSGSGASIGYTFFNDAPPGAGGLNNGEYCFAELGTATRGGKATGVGNLAKAFGLPGELPMGAQVSVTANGKTITIVKRDRGYGQGGDGVHSDPHFAIDFWDGSAFGGKNPMAALGLSSGEGTVSASYGGKTVGSGGGSNGASSGNGSSAGSPDLLTILGDLVSFNIQDLAVQLALASAALVKYITLGVFDWLIIPWWHWNQRAVDYYLNNELFTKDTSKWKTFPWTAAFWGLGYYLFWTDPTSGNLKPAPVRNSRAARHVRAAQALPARRSLIKPKDVKAKTPKKPKPTVSKATITQTGTMQVTRSVPVKVTGEHARQRSNEPIRSEVPIQRAGTVGSTEETVNANATTKPKPADRTGDRSLPNGRNSPETRSGPHRSRDGGNS